jgi:hypothetical protein
MPSNVSVEFEREGQQVVIALRCPTGRMTLSLPLDSALVFAISAGRITEVDSEDTTLSCILPRCELEIQK